MPQSEDNPQSKRNVLGRHPEPPHPFGQFLSAVDGSTDKQVPHRSLSEVIAQRQVGLAAIREMVVRHHVSQDALVRDARRRAAIEQLGLGGAQSALRRFPASDTTRKGNLAEIVLAEYIVVARNVQLPVYRLRYNPNVDQSMKGDDVLAFDLGSNPPRIIVGEAKYRATPTAEVVAEIVEALLRSHRSGIPASLQFVADRLSEAGEVYMADAVEDCVRQFALDILQIEYVGLLLGNDKVHIRVRKADAPSLSMMGLISLGLAEPNEFVGSCYIGLE